MELVKILNEYVVPTQILGLWVILGFSAFIVCLLAMAELDNYAVAIVCVVIIIGCVICGFLDVTTPKETRYDVLINDGVSYSDFAKVYSVVESKGEVLVVTLKDK